MKRLSTYPWQVAYVSAILETDDAKIIDRIYEAIAAIEQRRLDPSTIGDDESRALSNVDTGIQTLVTERA
jgi:hypothetical protein